MIRYFSRFCVFTAALAISVSAAMAQTADVTLYEDVRIFDGTSDTLSPSSNVLVRNGVIETISTSAIEATDATVIDGGGRVLMPGMIDAH